MISLINETPERWHRVAQRGDSVGQFALVPPGWAERRKTLADIEYDEGLRAEAEAFQDEPGAWWDRVPSLWAGAWPADVSLVQVRGSSKWGAFRDQDAHHGWHPPLADEQFLSTLRDAELNTGWHAAPIDVRDRNWEPRTSHQAVFVESRAPWKFPDEVAWAALTSDDRFYAWAVAPDSMDSGGAAFLWHDNGLFASPAAAAALAAAKLPAIHLLPLLYERELEAAMPGSVLERPPGP